MPVTWLKKWTKSMNPYRTQYINITLLVLIYDFIVACIQNKALTKSQ